MEIRQWYSLFVGCGLAMPTLAADLQISAFTRGGNISWTNAFVNGVCTIESGSAPSGPWTPERNFFTTNSAGQSTLPLSSGNGYYRLLAVDISTNTPLAFDNLVNSYGILETIAGKGEFGLDGLNNWLPDYEGGPATNANLSRPHFAMGDDAGNIFIADKDSHSILKVTPDGNIHTVAGTHVGGFNGDGPAAGSSLQLNLPNGEWVRGDGTVYILDTGNGKVRRLGTNGIMSTLFTVSGGINTGRGLWVKDDESLVYFASATALKKWTPAGGARTVNNSFVELGNLLVDPAGQLVVTDRGANRVYRVSSDGSFTAIAGNGNTSGGGDGFPALQTGLAGVRGVWFLPNGGYLLGTHTGSQVWYVDAMGLIRLFVDGLTGDVHSGDGEFFHSPGHKIGEVRSISVDARGDVLITENDYGYVRRIRFLRLQP